jgi:hypothetical protein
MTASNIQARLVEGGSRRTFGLLPDAYHFQNEQKIADLPELIVSAAVRVDGKVVMVERPGRHGDCINFLSGLGQDHRDQGFVTSRGRFVDRLEAGRIAMASGQGSPRAIRNGHLFSEDLWNTPAQALQDGR